MGTASGVPPTPHNPRAWAAPSRFQVESRTHFTGYKKSLLNSFNTFSDLDLIMWTENMLQLKPCGNVCESPRTIGDNVGTMNIHVTVFYLFLPFLLCAKHDCIRRSAQCNDV